MTEKKAKTNIRTKGFMCMHSYKTKGTASQRKLRF